MRFILTTILFLLPITVSAQLTVFRDTPEVAQSTTAREPVEKKPAKKAEPPHLIMYSTPSCGYCKIAQRYFEQNHPWIDFEVSYDLPNWVNAVPVFHYKDSRGKWSQFVGWNNTIRQQLVREMNELREAEADSALPAEAQPTPYLEIHRLLAEMKPKESETFVDPGCGDARACIAATSVYGCSSIGIEIDKERAELAKKRVKELGLDHKITIIHGDATKLNWKADVGFVYLYPDLLEKLKDKLTDLDRFASYQHQVPGLRMKRTGNSFAWDSGYRYEYSQSTDYAVWKGKRYTGRVCTSRNCRMCNSIAAQLRK